MTEASSLWLFGVIGAWLVVLSGAVLGLIIAQVKTNFAVNLFISTMGEKIAKALHADDDHLHLDALLDKMSDPNYELGYDELFKLKNECNFILSDKTVSHLERSLAGMLAAVCEYTLITKHGKTKKTV